MTPDAALVARVLGGDREAFASVYDRYADRLYDFAHSMLRNTEDASDAVADAFVVFAERLSQLREPDRLRPWLYAIVRSECLRRIKLRSRVAFGGDEQLVDMADTAVAPDEAAETSALRQLVWDAAGGLTERDRALLDLHLRQGLDGADLGEAMGVSASNAYVMMNRLRSQLERSLGALLIAKTGREECSDLDGTLADWDGSFSPLVRKRVSRHVDGCPKCTMRRAAMVSPLALFAGVSAFAAPAGLRERVLSSVTISPSPAVDASPWLRRGLVGGAVAAVIVALVVLVPGRLHDADHPLPVDATTTTEAPAAQPTPTTTPSPTPSATTANAVEPALLVVSDRSLSVGPRDMTTATTLANRGGTSLHFELKPSDGWVSADPQRGRLDPGESVRVAVRVSDGRRPRADTKAHIQAQWDHGSIDIEVRVKVAKEPEPEPDDNPPADEPPADEPPVILY